MGDLIVVFDTVVFVRALINPHSFWGRLVFEHSHEYRLFLTPQTLREYVEVLQRPELTRKFTAPEYRSLPDPHDTPAGRSRNAQAGAAIITRCQRQQIFGSR